MTILVDPAAVDEQIAAIGNVQRNHIFCDCHPTRMFCGAQVRVDPDGDLYDMPDGDECPDCYLVWLGGFCPYCDGYWTADDYKARGL